MATQTDKLAPKDIVSAPSSDARLPPPRVAAMRAKILEACAKGDIEALRIPIDWNEMRPLFERGAKRPPGEDPVERLKALSFDGKGRETIDLLRTILRQPFVTVTKGPTTLYVWPSFAVAPLVDPTPEERQIMLACVRFVDLHGAEPNGKPAPMEIAIGADGTWHYFWTSSAAGRRG
jgi:hypothetical protein